MDAYSNGTAQSREVHSAVVFPSGTEARKPTTAEVETAVETLIMWAGDDPFRPGLVGTPSRVARAYREWFGGYREDPYAVLERTFDEIGGYNEPVELRDIPFRSCCEHHMAAIRGKTHIAYLPDRRVVGISKLARVVSIYSRRLQIQERLTAEIASTIEMALKPRGVAVVIEAEHDCMTSRGIKTSGAVMVTQQFLGAYQADQALRDRFLASTRL